MTLRRGIALAIFVLAAIGVALAAGATGKWTATFNTQVGEQKYTWDLTANGSMLTGTYMSTNGSGPIMDGKIEGDDLSWVEMLKYQDMDLKIQYKAKMAGDELKIQRNVADIANEEATAKRAN